MKTNDYSCSFTVEQPSHAIFQAICQVNRWWATNVVGNTQALDEPFTVNLSCDTWVTFRVAVFAPDWHIAWLVTDCHLPWLSNQSEWNHTTLHFYITPTLNGNKLTVIHQGLSPDLECYDRCEQGWNNFAGKSLSKLITTGHGMPDTFKAKV
ncbi:hypothetical protein SAMN05444266_102173 [Chitinophaga jiangningensis]|uniref:Activator of Hsp90 ATPase homolog 1-like protein n=1 Tax=Chitinophaga jiangningensis TaxID=1419482 RepID=A0A1M6Y723_9BACT|nr:hypothetical protein [Chitinophaga jiangningensis]SHL13829.1 hypothetical protein SAMN05444266_102173 [Chitinophaga jiangningensis]